MSSKPAPKIPLLSEDIFTIPFVGAVKGYYILLLLLFFAYLITKNALVGLSAGALIVFIVAWEFYAGVKSNGFKSEAKETVFALALALLVWFGAGWLLNTPVPINAIVSCSMLPSYERGDMVVLQGAIPKAPVFDYEGSLSQINNTARILHEEDEFYVNGSMFAYCTQYGSRSEACAQFAAAPSEFEEYHGPVKITYGTCTRTWPKEGQQRETICALSAEFAGEKIPFDYTNDIVVYQPKPKDLYSLVGDIVHRAAFGVRASDGSIAYFTKGDNNPVFDFQVYDGKYNAGNSPVDYAQIKGKVIARIPYIGNFKMFITPPVLFSSSAESGCDSYFKSG